MRNVENRIIAVIGPEGAGKSTITRRLSEDLHIPRIYPGDILRAYAKSDHTWIGDEARDMFNNNAYLKPKTLLEVMKRRFAEGGLSDGFILDGSFRTLEETEGFPMLLKEAKLQTPVTVVSLRIPGWKSLDRLVTGPNARARSDDTSEGVLLRLGHFQNDLGFRMKAIRSHDSWDLLHINAMANIDDVYDRVKQALIVKKSPPDWRAFLCFKIKTKLMLVLHSLHLVL